MPVQSIFNKKRKIFANPESTWDDTTISWNAGTDSFTTKDGEQKFTDVDAYFSVGEGRDAYRFSVFSSNQAELAESMRTIELLIDNLAEFADAVAEAGTYLQEKEEDNDDSVPINV